MLVSNLSYSQYPILKKLGKDSVVIMTLKQANQVNSYYTDREAKILTLKDSLREQQGLAELNKAYLDYFQSEVAKNNQGNTGNIEELNKQYYAKRELYWENKIQKQARVDIALFVTFSILWVLIKL
jgi:hypothetical protein